jgi:hypothetical protein
LKLVNSLINLGLNLVKNNLSEIFEKRLSFSFNFYREKAYSAQNDDIV